jgi:hypothetical protein
VKLKNKNILITGGAGFIGSSLTDYFLENNNQVTVLDNLKETLTKGKFESKDNHRKRIKAWNDQNLTYPFEITKTIDYDPDYELLYANIDTTPIGIEPISIAIDITPIGMGNNVENFIEDMNATLGFKLYFDFTSNDIKAIVVRDSLVIEPKEYNSFDYVNIGISSDITNNITEELKKGWHETTDEWTNRVLSFNQKAVIDLTMENEANDYGYNADTKQMTANLDLTDLDFESKDINLYLGNAEKVVDFYNKGSAIIEIKAKIENSEVILYNDCVSARLGKEMIDFEMDGKYSKNGKLCENDGGGVPPFIELDNYTKNYCKNNPSKCGIEVNVENITNVDGFTQDELDDAVDSAVKTAIKKENIFDTSVIYDADMGWSLLGAKGDINNMDIFFKYKSKILLKPIKDFATINSDGTTIIQTKELTDIKLVWKYKNNRWSAYSTDSETMDLIKKSSKIDVITEIKKNEGFWILKD